MTTDADVVDLTVAKLRELLAAAEANERDFERNLAAAEVDHERAVKDVEQIRRAIDLLTEEGPGYA